MDNSPEEESKTKKESEGARRFIKAFKEGAKTLSTDKQPFYQVLTSLIEAVIERDETSGNLPLFTYGKPGDTEGVVFSTPRGSMWARDIGPILKGVETDEGKSIEIETTREGASKFNTVLHPATGLVTVRALENGTIIGGYRSGDRHEPSTVEMIALQEILQESSEKMAKQVRDWQAAARLRELFGDK